MATLNIQVSRTGIDKITADTASIADVKEAGELIQATSLASRLMHQSVREYFAEDGQLSVESPRVWLPRSEDGLQDSPREVKILVADGPRDPFDDPPQWFIDSMKKAFPDHPFWTNAEELPGGDSEASVMIFQDAISKREHWLDHWGFVGAKGEDSCDSDEVLVTEPYGISLMQIAELIPLFSKCGWTFNIVGKSAHYPSATIRLEIKPKESQ